MLIILSMLMLSMAVAKGSVVVAGERLLILVLNVATVSPVVFLLEYVIVLVM